MRFVWHPENIGHVARHGLKPEEVEAVFEAADMTEKQAKSKKRKTYRAVSELPKVFVPVEAAKRAGARDAAWIEERFGPGVPRLTGPGRPPRGTKVEPGRVRSVRVSDPIWNALKKRAEETGLTTNAALRLAVASWTGRAGTSHRS